jgi:signal peptidase I
MSKLTPYLAALSRSAINSAAAVAGIYVFFHDIASFADIQGDSMYPTLNGGSNYLLIQKWQAQNTLKVGDVIILRSPVDPEVLLVKRLIGLNGQVIPVPVDTNSIHPEVFAHNPNVSLSKPLVIPPGHMWLEGDNLPYSIDSRHFGAVPQALLVGIARGKIDFGNFKIDLNSLNPPPLWNPQTRKIVPINAELYTANQSKLIQDEELNSICMPTANNSSQLDSNIKLTQYTSTHDMDYNPYRKNFGIANVDSNFEQSFNKNNQNHHNFQNLSNNPHSLPTTDPTSLISLDNTPQSSSSHPTPSIQSPNRKLTGNFQQNEQKTRQILNYIHEKRARNIYHQNIKEEEKFQKYLSSYNRVHNPNNDSIYSNMMDNINIDNIMLGSGNGGVGFNRNKFGKSNENEQNNQNNNVENEMFFYTRSQQLDLLLPELTPEQRAMLLGDGTDSDPISSNEEFQKWKNLEENKNPKNPKNPKNKIQNNQEISNPEPNYDFFTTHPSTPQEGTIFSFKWEHDHVDTPSNQSFPNNTPTHSPLLPPQTLEPTPATPFNSSNHQRHQTDEFTIVPPQIGDIRTKLNPYLDVIPNDKETVLVPDEYLKSITSSTKGTNQNNPNNQ